MGKKRGKKTYKNPVDVANQTLKGQILLFVNGKCRSFGALLLVKDLFKATPTLNYSRALTKSHQTAHHTDISTKSHPIYLCLSPL